MSESTAGYGITTPRDEDGNLLPDDHEFEWSGDEVKIQIIPPTISQWQRYQNLNVEDEEEYEDHHDILKDIIDEHLVKPEIPKDDLTLREVNCYIEGIMDYGRNGGGARMEAVRQELEEMSEEEGN